MCVVLQEFQSAHDVFSSHCNGVELWSGCDSC